MKILVPSIMLLSFLAALVAQMIYFLRDNATPDTDPKNNTYKKYWHWAGGAIHIWFGYTMETMYGHGWGWLAGASTWYFFDGALNLWYFHKPFFWIGTTAMVDKVQQSIARWFGEDPVIISAVLKNVVLILALSNTFIW